MMDSSKELAYLTERRAILANQSERLELMEEAIRNRDEGKLLKLKRDFEDMNNKWEWVEKRDK